VIPEDERLDLELLRDAVAYQEWVMGVFAPAVRGDVLEVGAGIGNFTRWIARRAERVMVAEPDASMAEEVERLSPPNVEVRASMLEMLDVGERRFDAAVMINVLEHIEDEAAALRAVRSLLRPGGRLCLFVPAHMALFGSLDKRYGHLRRYRRDDVAAQLADVGFEVELCRYFNVIGALGWWAVGRVARRPRLSVGSVRLSERVAVPVGRWLDRLGFRPFGQSVIAIARASE